MSIIERLAAIQLQLDAPKSRVNSFAKYNYRNCEDILEALKPLLGDSVVLLSDEIVMVGDRVYVKATATLKAAEDNISVSAYAREPLDKKGSDHSQITGAASSYARKYALNGLFLIDDTKDADSSNNSASKPADRQITENDVKWLDAIRAGKAKLTGITDPEHRKFIEGHL